MRTQGDGGEAAKRLVGTTFAGKYRIVQLLRSGGISDVYVAEQLTLRPAPRSDPPPQTASSGVPEALKTASARPGSSDFPRPPRATRLGLKVLRERFRNDKAVTRRFERGALAAAQVSHPNVVETRPPERLPSGLPYHTMELLIGLDLADLLAYEQKLDPIRAARFAESAAAGLSAAHQAGVIHLDIKPENIFVVHEPDGRELIKILDFGLAGTRFDPAAHRVDAACGTPEYMAPEQHRGAVAAPAMDVYALGVVLHEMLTGRPPAQENAAPLWDLPSGFARLLQRALAEDPGDRFETMEDLRAALTLARHEIGRGSSGFDG